MKYGVIGTGWIAESFIEGAREASNAEFTAVYSRTMEKGSAFADKNNIRNVYTSLSDMLNTDIEAVYIASPNAKHYEQTKMCLLCGKHVICEKPITVTPEELQECIKIADDNNLVYIEAIMYMHTPDRESLKNALDKIGVITSAHFDFSQLSSKYAAYKRGEIPNIFNPALATGSLMDLGVYCAYPAIDIFGVPDSIVSSASFLETGADGSGSAIFNYGDKLVTLTYSKTGQDYAGSCIYGDEGTIEIESISKMINIYLTDNKGNKSLVCGEREKEEIMGFEALEFERFIQNPCDIKYAECKRISLEVSKAMEKIRSISGIKFKEN